MRNTTMRRIAVVIGLPVLMAGQGLPDSAISLCEMVAKRQTYKGKTVWVKAALALGPGGVVFRSSEGGCKIAIDGETRELMLSALVRPDGPELPRRREEKEDLRNAKSGTERMTVLWGWVLVATFVGVFDPETRLSGHGGSHDLDHGQFRYLGHRDGVWTLRADHQKSLTRPARGFENGIQ